MLKEREAQIEMKKIVEQMHKEREMEKEREVMDVLEERARRDNEKDNKKQDEINKLTEFHKRQ